MLTGIGYAGILAETFLRSALESLMVYKTMDAEGRTKLSPGEEATLQAATDAAAAAARREGEDL